MSRSFPTTHRRRQRLLNVAGVLLAAALLWTLFATSDWSGVADALAQLDHRALLIAVALMVLSLFTRALRWRSLLRGVLPDVSLALSWRGLNIGLAVNTLLPGRPGDLLQPLVVSSERPVPYATALATVGATRLLDLLSICAMLGVPWLWPEALGDGPDTEARRLALTALRTISVAAVGAAGVGTVGVALVQWRPQAVATTTRRALEWVAPRLAARVERAVGEFATGLALGSARRTFAIAAFTVLTWASLAAGFWFTLAAFEIFVSVPQVFLFLAVAGLGVAVPTPGGLGTYHAAVVLVVGELWGHAATADATVDACALISHLVAFAPIVVIGGAYLLHRPIRLPSRPASGQAVPP